MAKRKSQSRGTGSEGAAQQAKRFCPNYTDTVTVLAGDTKEPFVIHKDILCEHSIFFTSACSRAWRTGREKEIPLPDVEAKIFQLYVHWLYREEIDLSLVGIDEKAQPTPDSEKVRTVWCDRNRITIRLHIAADFLGDVVLKNLSIDRLARQIQQQRRLPSLAEHIPYVWDATPPDSGLRHLILDATLTLSGLPEWFGKMKKKEIFPADFYYDLAMRQLELMYEREDASAMPGPSKAYRDPS